MADDKYNTYFPNILEKRKNMFKEFYRISFDGDLPVTDKNRNCIGFHPLVSSYVLRHILWEILNCPGGSNFKEITKYTVNKDIYERSLGVFDRVYDEGTKGKYIFGYDDGFTTGSRESSYSGLTNAKMLYIYSYYNLIRNSKKYTAFCNGILNSLLLDMKKGGCCILYAKDRKWIDEEANYPNFILNGFLSIIRNLIDLVACVKNPSVEKVLLQNKVTLEELLPMFDCEEYKTSKYRLTTYGDIHLLVKNKKNKRLSHKDFKINIIYNDEYSYQANYIWGANEQRFKCETFRNVFTVYEDVIIIHFVYSEVFKNKIEVTFVNEDFNIIDCRALDYSYRHEHTGACCYKRSVGPKKADLSLTKNGTKTTINADKRVMENFKPSITFFSKLYKEKLYNVYHYNHIKNLSYVNKYFNSEILTTYINKWTKYTEEWKDFPLYNEVNGEKNVCYSSIELA